MKIAGVVDEAIVTGVTGVTEFKINATAKSFKILSSQIYTDKLGTAPRELGANAVDAHKEAGTEEPFIVHLPNDLEPFYTIRDFGTGMSRKKIETLYTTYFASDKCDTNDLIGGLGLGSKSPFCYVDQFSVISYYNKQKFVYSAFLENGLPKIAFILEDVTTERNGMEISFPVKTQDIYNFNARAKEIYSYFRLKPIIKGINNFQFAPIKYILKSDKGGWMLRDVDANSSNPNSRIATAIMGNIGYPINRSNLTHAGFTSKQLTVLDCPFDIDFKIGELEIVASRESLEYDDRTISVLKERLNDIVGELKVFVQREFDKCATRFEAHCLYGELFGSYSSTSYGTGRTFSYLLNDVVFTWNGVEIRTSSLQFMKGADAKDDLKSEEIEVIRYHLGSNRNGDDVAKSQVVFNVTCRKGSNTKFFFKDMEIGSIARLRHFIKDDKNDSKEAFLVEFKHPTARERFVKNLCAKDSDLRPASSLPRPPRKNVSTTGKKLKRVLVYNNGTSRQAGSNWNDDHVEIIPNDKTKFYYVKVMSKQLDYSAYNGLDVRNLSDIKKFLEVQGISVGNIYGLTAYKNLIEKNSNWIDFIDFAKKEITKLVASKNLEQLHADYKSYNEYVSASHLQPRDNMLLNTLVSFVTSPTSTRTVKSDKFNEILEQIKYLKDQHAAFAIAIPNYDSLGGFLNQIKFAQDKKPKYSGFQIKKDFYDTYPLVSYLDSYALQSSNQGKDIVLQYIEKLS